MPEDLVYLKVQSKAQNFSFEINDYDNFEHVSDLVIEELEELQSKGKICTKQQQLKKEVAFKVDSIY